MNKLIKKIVNVSTGAICDSNDKVGGIDPEIRPLDYSMKVAGPAFTVECSEGDNLAIHIAIEQAKPGDVLVINGGGNIPAGLFGDVFATSCIQQGIAGVVIDGYCRDRENLIKMKFPVFAKGASPNGTIKKNWAAINSPMLCGGKRVNPGDLIVADSDGVVVIASSKAESVVNKAIEKEKFESEIKTALTKGELTIDLFSLRDQLEKRG